MKGPFAKIEQDLSRLLHTHFMDDIYEIREKRLSRILNIVRDMTGKLPEKNTTAIIGAGIEQLQTFTQIDDHSTIDDQIIHNISALKNELPERVAYHQISDRFHIYPDDTYIIKIAKKIKQLTRKMGKSEWIQQIPLQNVVAYHLLDADWFFEDWLAAEERLLMQITLELDQVLAHTAKKNKKDDNNSELQQLLKVVQNKIEEAQRVHKKNLNEAHKKLIRELISIVSVTGTLERSAIWYSEKRLNRKRERVKQNLDEYQQKWQKINQLLLDRTTELYELIVFCDDLEDAAESFRDDIQTYFNRLFAEPYHLLEDKIISVRRKVIQSKKNLTTVLSETNGSLKSFIQQQILQPIRDRIEQGELQQKIENYIETQLAKVQELDEQVIFITDIDRHKDPPNIKSRNLKWQALIAGRLNENIFSRIALNNKEIDDFKYRQLREVQEIEGIIEVNLESALELTQGKTGDENPHDVVAEALQRAQTKVEKIDSEAKEMVKSLLAPLDGGVLQFKESMFDLLHQGDAEHLRMLDAKYKVTEKARGWTTQFQTGWAGIKDKGSVFSRFIRNKSKYYYDQSQVFLGFKKDGPREEIKAGLTAYLSETEQKISELPYIYRRIFNFNAPSESRYYVGWNIASKTMQEAYDHWKKGLAATMAVIGEKGSGKSTYLELIQEKIVPLERVMHIHLEATIWTEEDLLSLFNREFVGEEVFSVEELASFLKHKRENTVIIFEGVQNLYARYLNGYEAIEKLMFLVADTSDKIFWITSCSHYAWTFLNQAFGMGDYFSHIVSTDRLSEAQIKKMIMKRHQASGYELIFISSENDTKNRTFKRLQDDEQKQAYLKEKYFVQLAELAEGNASIAMIFWIRSIQKYDDTYFYVAPLEATSLELLEDLTPETLFVLASLVLHDILMADELAMIQNRSLQESRMLLHRLKNKGIVLESEYGFSLNQLVYRQVINELRERNVLHF